MLVTVIATALAVFVMMYLLWLIQIKTKKADVVDIAWSYNFSIIALMAYLLAEGFPQRKLLFTVMICLWSIRLGTHLYTRVMSHKEEEGRYQELRRKWAPNVNWNFFVFFTFQALTNILLALPIYVVTANVAPQLSILEYIGFALWLIALLGESLADRQLKKFKADPDNKGKVCDVGLWNYSRHPNYFFEWSIWVAYFVFALASPWGFTVIICPAIMLYFLLKVTGIPMTEEQSIRSRGDAYREYQKTTSMFVPWRKKQ